MRKKGNRPIREDERLRIQKATEKAREELARIHNFHDTPLKTTAQIKADERAKSITISKPRKRKFRQPYVRIIYTSMYS